MELDFVRTMLQSANLAHVSRQTGVNTKALEKMRNRPGYEPRYSDGVKLIRFFGGQCEPLLDLVKRHFPDAKIVGGE